MYRHETNRCAPGRKRSVRSEEKRHKRAFTLVEMLVVLVIISIMIGIAVPTFKGISEGYTMNAALNQVRNALSLARQYAIMNNTSTLFLVPSPDLVIFSDADAKDHVDKCLRTYAIYDKGNSTYLTPWTYLPKGIMFLTKTTRDGNIYGTNAVPASGLSSAVNFLDYRHQGNLVDVSIPFPATNNTSQAFIELDFRNDGSSELTRSVSVMLVEGNASWPASGTGLDSSSLSQYLVTSKSLATTNAIVVYPMSGRLEVVQSE